MKGKYGQNGDMVEEMFPLKEDRHSSKKGKSLTLSSKEPKDPANHKFSQKRAGAFYHWLEEETADVIAELHEEQQQAAEEYDQSEGYKFSDNEVEFVNLNEDDDWGEVAMSQSPSSPRSPSSQRGTLFYHQVATEEIDETWDSTLTATH